MLFALKSNLDWLTLTFILSFGVKVVVFVSLIRHLLNTFYFEFAQIPVREMYILVLVIDLLYYRVLYSLNYLGPMHAYIMPGSMPFKNLLFQQQCLHLIRTSTGENFDPHRTESCLYSRGHWVDTLGNSYSDEKVELQAALSDWTEL